MRCRFMAVKRVLERRGNEWNHKRCEVTVDVLFLFVTRPSCRGVRIRTDRPPHPSGYRCEVNYSTNKALELTCRIQPSQAVQHTIVTKSLVIRGFALLF